jgi:hypothetical protein
VYGGIQADCKVAWVGFDRVVDSPRRTVGFGEEAIVHEIPRASTLWEEGEIAE